MATTNIASIDLPPNPLPAGSYNTYIGARYVPIIGGNWDKTKSYEPLTIVINEGNSYTSRTYVPEGVDITNTTYWAMTGSYNAQYEQLYNQVNVNSGNINSVATELHNLIQSIQTAEDSSWLVVSQSGGGQYTTITEAVDAAKDIIASTHKRVTLFITSGVYYESINLLGNPGIDLFGIGSVTINSSATYPDAALYVTRDINCYNINFAASGNSYSVHIEAQDDATAQSAVMVFKNCGFYAASNHGVGVGMGANYNLTFEYCGFNSGTQYGLYCHNYPVASSNTSQLFLNFCSFNLLKSVAIDDAYDINSDQQGHSYMIITSAHCNGLSVRFAEKNRVLSYVPPASANIQISGANRDTLIGLDAVRRYQETWYPETVMTGSTYYVGQSAEDVALYTPTVDYVRELYSNDNILSQCTIDVQPYGIAITAPSTVTGPILVHITRTPK